MGSLEGKEWQECFPFVGDFEQIVRREITMEYVTQLAYVLEPVVAAFSGIVEKGIVTNESVGCLFFSVNALARCRVVQAYQSEIEDKRVDRHALLNAVVLEWEAMEKRDCLAVVDYMPAVGKVLGDSVRMVWVTTALQTMTTARDICRLYPSFVMDVRVVPVAQVLVVGEKGRPLIDLLHEHGDKLLLPVAVYRMMCDRLSRVDLVQDVHKPPDIILRDSTERLDVGFGYLESDKMCRWLWLLLVSSHEMQGYCYQRLFPPAMRYSACVVLRQQPLVRDVLWHLDGIDSNWTDRFADIEWADVLHVSSSGLADLVKLRDHSTHRIGMQSILHESAEVDYYARALLDEFIAKHKPLPSPPEIPAPLDVEFESLSVSSESTAGREFVDIANMLYSAVDESLSPRAEEGDADRTGHVSAEDVLGVRDSEIVQEIYNRLNGGAVIHESYFQRTYRRFRRVRRRPQLDQSDGRVYHVFAGFPAESGVGLGPWQLDKNWNIPGWRSYVAEFDAGDERTVSFTVDDGCQDIRMDCSGEGAIDLGDCKVRVSGTLLWFTNSIRLLVKAKSDVCLRISVPDAGSAMAIGADMRRYMHVPGYAVVARSYDVVTGNTDFSVTMERMKRASIAGCHLYSGQRHVERGRHRFKITKMASLAPARVVLKTEPPDALDYVSVCGMRMMPRSRDYVPVTVDMHNVEMHIQTNISALLMVSVAQVVREKEFELAVISNTAAKAARLAKQVAQ